MRTIREVCLRSDEQVWGEKSFGDPLIRMCQSPPTYRGASCAEDSNENGESLGRSHY